MNIRSILNEVPIVRGKVLEGYLLTNESEENLKRYNLPYTSYKNSLGLPSLWVDDKYKELMDKAGIRYWNPLGSDDFAPFLLLQALCQ